MIIVVTGDREWESLETISEAFKWFLNHYKVTPEQVMVIEGEARGADKRCRLVAEEMGMNVKALPAEWEKYGRAAGPIRNQSMLDFHPEVCLAFHDDLENSKGTKDMVKRSKKFGIPVWHFQTKSKTPVLL